MSIVTGMFKIPTLVNGLIEKDPSKLTVEQLEQLQQFVNRGRSAMLVASRPQLESIFVSCAMPQYRNKVLDILICYLTEGEVPGTNNFRKLVDGMVDKGYVGAEIVDSLERNKFLLPNHIPTTNADGVAV